MGAHIVPWRQQLRVYIYMYNTCTAGKGYPGYTVPVERDGWTTWRGRDYNLIFITRQWMCVWAQCSVFGSSHRTATVTCCCPPPNPEKPQPPTPLLLYSAEIKIIINSRKAICCKIEMDIGATSFHPFTILFFFCWIILHDTM